MKVIVEDSSPTGGRLYVTPAPTYEDHFLLLRYLEKYWDGSPEKIIDVGSNVEHRVHLGSDVVTLRYDSILGNSFDKPAQPSKALLDILDAFEKRFSD